MAASIPNSWVPQQFENPANPEIHRLTTAQEIVADFPEGVDYFISAKHYHADSGALMGESEYKNDVRDGRYRRYYFDEGGALKQEGVFKADKREGVSH